MDLNELKLLAEQQMAEHGLCGWTFCFSKAKRMLGVCKYRAKRIEIAEYYAANSPRETVVDTLLHEIAHALAGSRAGHGPAWKAIAKRLGATPRACESSTAVVTQPGAWQATCPACQRIVHRYKRPATLTGYHCRCEARASLTFEYQGDPARKPNVPQTIEQSARWAAKCPGCQTVHYKVRKPQAGTWLCRCPQHCQLTWHYYHPAAETR